MDRIDAVSFLRKYIRCKGSNENNLCSGDCNICREKALSALDYLDSVLWHFEIEGGFI